MSRAKRIIAANGVGVTAAPVTSPRRRTDVSGGWPQRTPNILRSCLIAGAIPIPIKERPLLNGLLLLDMRSSTSSRWPYKIFHKYLLLKKNISKFPRDYWNISLKPLKFFIKCSITLINNILGDGVTLEIIWMKQRS